MERERPTSSRLPTPILASGPDPDAVGRAADLLARARSPLIIIGDGVAVSDAQAEVVRLAELLGAQVYNTFGSHTPFPSDHPLYAGLLNLYSVPGLLDQLSAADVILAVGTSVFPFIVTLDESPFPRGAKVIHIDLDTWELATSWPVDLPILADPKPALADLLDALGERLTPAQRGEAQERATVLSANKAAMLEAVAAASQAGLEDRPMSPARFAKELAAALDPSTLVYDESISAFGQLLRHLRFREPNQHLRSAGGGLGPGMPSPIGLKLACPERQVVGIVADGGALYTIQALWTAAHHRIPVTWVIVNNASYRILKINMTNYRGEGALGRGFIGVDLVDPPLDFARIAQAFGVKGVRVEDPADIGDAVRAAQRPVSHGWWT